MGSKMDYVLDATGNVGRDVESAYTPAGKLVARTSMAVEVGYGEYKRTEWLNLVVWGEKFAQNFANLVQKGTRLRIQGDPKLNVWIGKDGEAKGTLDVSVREFSVIKNGKPKSGDEVNPYDSDDAGDRQE